MDTEEIKKLLQSENFILLDVDPPALYEEGHPSGSYNYPFSRFRWGERLKESLGNETPKIGVFASNQVTADSAASGIRSVGLDVAMIFSQGISAWQNMGLPASKLNKLSVDHLSSNLDKYRVVDVREKFELSSGIIPGAISIPMSEFQARMNAIPKEQPCAVICAHGNRSREVAKFLADSGYDAYTVDGGMAMWLSRGYDVEDPY